MKTNFKLLLAGILIIAIDFSLSHCKSPTTPLASATVAIDTTDQTKTVDTQQIAITPTAGTPVVQTPLTLIITNLASDTAPVIVGVYGTKNKFPDPKDQLKEYKFKPHGKKLTTKITDLKFDTYALAIYQDVNSNGKIDKDLIGIPTEPYAFSNNYKPTVKAPGFDNCKFQYDSIANTVTMNMIGK